MGGGGGQADEGGRDRLRLEENRRDRVQSKCYECGRVMADEPSRAKETGGSRQIEVSRKLLDSYMMIC